MEDVLRFVILVVKCLESKLTVQFSITNHITYLKYIFPRPVIGNFLPFPSNEVRIQISHVSNFLIEIHMEYRKTINIDLKIIFHIDKNRFTGTVSCLKKKIKLIPSKIFYQTYYITSQIDVNFFKQIFGWQNVYMSVSKYSLQFFSHFG